MPTTVPVPGRDGLWRISADEVTSTECSILGSYFNALRKVLSNQDPWAATEFEGAPSNALTHTGEPVGPRTEGLLKPAPTHVTAVDIIGRESRRWEDGRGILTPPNINTYTTRTDPEGVARLLRKHYHWPGSADLIAAKTGLSIRTISAILAGKKPSQRSAERLWEFAHQQSLDLQWERGLGRA